MRKKAKLHNKYMKKMNNGQASIIIIQMDSADSSVNPNYLKSSHF